MEKGAITNEVSITKVKIKKENLNDDIKVLFSQKIIFLCKKKRIKEFCLVVSWNSLSKVF